MTTPWQLKDGRLRWMRWGFEGSAACKYDERHIYSAGGRPGPADLWQGRAPILSSPFCLYKTTLPLKLKEASNGRRRRFSIFIESGDSFEIECSS